ncbi:MAG: hypothetical protein QGI09_00505, partial [Dehalococcoidia bacterium]|nr:hypothetical protein [Dehalococcoidia bacterium]
SQPISSYLHYTSPPIAGQQTWFVLVVSANSSPVVGSALIELVENTPDEQRVEAVKDFVAGLKGTVPTKGRQ